MQKVQIRLPDDVRRAALMRSSQLGLGLSEYIQAQ